VPPPVLLFMEYVEIGVNKPLDCIMMIVGEDERWRQFNKVHRCGSNIVEIKGNKSRLELILEEELIGHD
jgi:hypothetical protein